MSNASSSKTPNERPAGAAEFLVQTWLGCGRLDDSPSFIKYGEDLPYAKRWVGATDAMENET